MSDTDKQLKRAAREAANLMADILQQEYKMHEGRWWLWSLGKPARPLSNDEVQDAIDDGYIEKRTDV